MSAEQLDLFCDFGGAAVRASATLSAPSSLDVAKLDDGELLAGFAHSTLVDSQILLAEAGRRRLAAAVPLLRDVCRRHAGFGARRQIPEQAAALNALHAIGTRTAAQAVAEAIERGWVEGPTLTVAALCAGRLHANLSSDTIAMLLQHPDPSVRVAGCRCARPYPVITALLGELMVDPRRPVAEAAACALGRLARTEARPVLAVLLEKAPSEEVIEAASTVADEPTPGAAWPDRPVGLQACACGNGGARRQRSPSRRKDQSHDCDADIGLSKRPLLSCFSSMT
jgi:hypothetical protein